MPLFPSRKKGPIGGHVTEEDYVPDEPNDLESSNHGPKSIPSFIMAPNLTEEEYVGKEADDGMQQARTLSGDVNSGENERVEDRRTGNGAEEKELGKVKVPFWKRALSRGKKEKRPATGAVTEEEYFEPEDAKTGVLDEEAESQLEKVTMSKSKCARTSETKDVETSGSEGADSTSLDNTIISSSEVGSTDGELNLRTGAGNSSAVSQDGFERCDSVRGETAYESLVEEQSAAVQSSMATRGGDKSMPVAWNGPTVDDDIGRHMQDLRMLMLPRRPGFEPKAWDATGTIVAKFGSSDAVFDFMSPDIGRRRI